MYSKYVRYNIQNKTVKQFLGSVDKYSFTGEFETVIDGLQEKYEGYKAKYCDKSDTWPGKYIDGTTKKEVKFDKIYIELEPDMYEPDSVEYHVWGERLMTLDEVAAVEEQEKQRLAMKELADRKRWEELNKKFA